MAKVMDGLKKIIGLDEFDEDINVTEEELMAATNKVKKEVPLETSAGNSNSYSSGLSTDSRKDISMQSKRYGASETRNLKLIVIEPRNFEEAKKLVSNLKMKKPIIVNLEKLETETAKNIFYYLNGAIEALEGNVTKVTSNIYVFAPSNVGITESKDTNNKPKKSKNESVWQ